MNCPKCNSPQPFDLKCVQCDADIAATFKTEKTTLRTYRVGIFLLTLLAIWLAYRPAQKIVITKAPQSQNNRNSFERPDRVRHERQPSQTKPTANPGQEEIPKIIAFLQKENFRQYEVMAELKDSFRHEILGVDLEDRVQVDLTAYDPNTTRAFIGIGFEAGQVLLEANPRIPTLILTLDQSLSPGPAQENILSLGPNIPFEAEWNIVSRLFPEQTQWILISANEIQRQKENEWAQKNINLKTFGPNPSQLEEELAHTDKNPPIVWLQRLNPIDRVQMLELGALGPFITLSGPPLGVLPNPVPESLAETPIETQEEILSSEEFNGDNPPIPPLIEIKISPQLLARQGALLLRQILKDPQTSPSLDAYLAKTLEVEIHVRKALAMEKEELIHQIKENGRKAGLKVNLVP